MSDQVQDVRIVSDAPGVTNFPPGGGLAYRVQGEVYKTNAGSAGAGQVLRYFSGKTASSASATTTVVLETVPAGKTLFLTDIFFFSDAAQSAPCDMQIQAGGVNIFRGPVHQITPVNAPGIETQPQAAAGVIVQLFVPIVAAAPNVWWDIFGFEQ